ncbi:hypothetical protein DXG01_002789 [Tephrocybe rancida]|nr:hypothetical protein DXG01_002789 [Tephrocybe rancida]
MNATHIEEMVDIADILRSMAPFNQPHNLQTPTTREDIAMEDNLNMLATIQDSIDIDVVTAEVDNACSPGTQAPTPPYYKEMHPSQDPSLSQIHGTGRTMMDDFKADKYSNRRVKMPFYPFVTQSEWKLASFLLRCGLSMAKIDEFLKLEKDLRSRAEILPQGPQWKAKPWATTCPTKYPVTLFYKDPIECLQSLLHSPLVNDSLSFGPFRLFKTAEKLARVYTEWLSGDVAWEMQSQLPPGATLLGTVLSSDKTTITAMTGNRSAHPLLINLANLLMSFQTKATNHAYVLLALLPIPKFIHSNKELIGVLEARLIHQCLDFVVAPLKKAAEIGVMMSDPVGQLRYCFTPLAGYIVDTPESALLAGVMGQTSSVTMASVKEFGDPFRHEPRTAAKTLAMLEELASKVNPQDMEAYVKQAKHEDVRLSGVHLPFWRDWPLSDPVHFLTPEPLHHWHKAFWDHDAKWCIKVSGKDEIDFRFHILQPHTGFRHFKEGISKLKQVTGREHRDVQRCLVPLVAGCVPKNFLIAIRALMDFKYLAQATEIDDLMCGKIEEALKEFHDHKEAVVKSGARMGAKKKDKSWASPKMEFLQSVVPSIRANGVAIQWSADHTEHAHITEIKNPSRMTNNQNYETQILRHLDRLDKVRCFDLMTAIQTADICFSNPSSHTEDAFDDYDPDDETLTTTSSLLAMLHETGGLSHSGRPGVHYFQMAAALSDITLPKSGVFKPFRTGVSSSNVAFHLTRDPNFKKIKIEDVMKKYNLPDLRGALYDYLEQIKTSSWVCSIGGKRIGHKDSYLPITHLNVWTRVRLQQKAYHYPHEVLAPQTLNAQPPSDAWPLGYYDAALANTDQTKEWPSSGIHGHTVVQRLDIVPQSNPKITGSSVKGYYPESATMLYVVKRARRANKIAIGDVIPLDQLHTMIDLTPRLGKVADTRLSKTNSMEHSEEFWVNKYFTKELFYALEMADW